MARQAGSKNKTKTDKQTDNTKTEKNIIKSTDETEKTRKALREFINKKFSSLRSYSIGSDDFDVWPDDRVSTGSLRLDVALGGGILRGASVKIQGFKSSGKSKLLASLVAEFSARRNELVAYFDSEGTSGKEWLYAHGADMNNVEYVSTTVGEDAFEAIIHYYNSGIFSAVFIDSLAAMVPSKIIDTSIENATVGALAQKATHFFSKMFIARNNFRKKGQVPPNIFFTNHVRFKIGDTFDPETTPGGQAQDNFADIIISALPIQRIFSETSKGERVYHGFYTQFHVSKNKTYIPFRNARCGIILDPEGYEGHNRFQFYIGEELREYGEITGVINQKGAWYDFNGIQNVQGKSAANRFIMSNMEIRKLIIESVKNKFNLPNLAFSPDFLTRDSSGRDTGITFEQSMEDTKIVIKNEGLAADETENAKKEIDEEQFSKFLEGL